MTMNMEQPTKLVIDCELTDGDVMKEIILILMDGRQAEWSWEEWK